MTDSTGDSNDLISGSELSQQILSAIEAENIDLVESAIRGGEFILFQQVDPESGEVEEDAEGNFSVVIAELEEHSAVVCFTDPDIATNFVNEVVDDLPVGQSLPSVILDGDVLLDGLPEDCGLLLNPTSDEECFFPPGTFQPE